MTEQNTIDALDFEQIERGPFATKQGAAAWVRGKGFVIDEHEMELSKPAAYHQARPIKAQLKGLSGGGFLWAFHEQGGEA